VASWTAKDNPITRLRKHLEANGLWDDRAEAALRTDTRKRIVEAFNKAEKRKKPPVHELFTDVYDTLPPLLQAQEQELRAHLAKYPKDYPVDQHADAMTETIHGQPKRYL
jgi:2-oxoisovalerate dehydrogenase E1 component alpha subunit